MRIAAFFACTEVKLYEDRYPDVINAGMSLIEVTAYPAVIPFTFFYILIRDAVDKSEKQRLTLRTFLDEEEVDSNPVEVDFRDDMAIYPQVCKVGARIHADGRYRFELHTSGKEPWKWPVRIRRKNPQANTQEIFPPSS